MKLIRHLLFGDINAELYRISGHLDRIEALLREHMSNTEVHITTDASLNGVQSETSKR